MRISFAAEGRDRLTCVMSDEETTATIEVSGQSAALSALAEAVEAAAGAGIGECYWRQAGGEYRWALRRAGPLVRIAVLWSSGTVTGWEHVFWSECVFEDFREQVLRAAATTAV